jgi:glyoxylase-like metal-dependent hydrolase (beta-lactamase superfamily II)
MTVLIECYPSGPFQTNTYLLISTSTGDAVVVDPAPDSADSLLAAIQQHKKTLLAVWITHSHWDHTADCHALLAQHNVPVMVHQLDSENLISPGSDGLPSLISIPPLTTLTYINDGDVLSLGKGVWTVLHSPGHSLGSVCFYNADDGILLSGDTLFKGTMGNISFPTSSPYLMGETLLKLSALPPATRVFPGHGPSTTIAKERSWMVTASQKLLE